MNQIHAPAGCHTPTSRCQFRRHVPSTAHQQHANKPTNLGATLITHYFTDSWGQFSPAAGFAGTTTSPLRCGRLRRQGVEARATSALSNSAPSPAVPANPPVNPPVPPGASASATLGASGLNGASRSYTNGAGSTSSSVPQYSGSDNGAYSLSSNSVASSGFPAADRGAGSASLNGNGASPSLASSAPRSPALRPTAETQQRQQPLQSTQRPTRKQLSTSQQLGPGDPRDGDESDIEIPEFMEPSVYDAAMNSRYWETRPVRVLARLVRIVVEFCGWLAVSRAHGLHMRDPAAREAAAAEALKDVLVRLGPAFVKIGQALSSRPDVLPPPYIAALEALQDRIPPFPDAAAMAVLEAELGAPPAAVFARLSPRPVAAASLGQVYRGSLRAELGGGEVAVKVQRPRVAQMIAQDVYILRLLAGWLRRARRFNTDLPALVDEWASSLFRELNYRTEAENAKRFKELFSHLPQVYVPHIYDDVTTSKVLTMEWIDGERLRTAGASASERGVGSPLSSSPTPSPTSTAPIYPSPDQGRPRGSGSNQPSPSSSSAAAAVSSSSSATASSPSSPSSASSSSPSSASSSSPSLAPASRRADDLALVEVGVRCSLEQMLEEGFYHADPHPGNLLRTPDGRLAYLDFGMMGQIDERTRNALMTATLHLVNREYGRLAEDFVTLGFLPPGTDRQEVLPALTGVFTDALKAGVSNLSFGQLSGNLGVTMYKYSFRIPPYYTLLVRSLSVLEGIALASDPNYKVLGSAYPWIARRLLTDPSPDLRVALRRLLYNEAGRFRFDRLESLLRQAAKSASRLKRPPASQQPLQQHPAPTSTATAAPSSPSSSSGGSSSSSSSSAGGNALQLLLSPDGEFVRDILLDEVAKGIDGAWRIAADATVASVRKTITNLPSAAVPVLALIPGAPLIAAALLAATKSLSSAGGSSADGSATAAGGGAAAAVQGSLAAALARLPSLATEDDRAQVSGLLQLGNALADVAGLKLPVLNSPSPSDPSSSPAPSSPSFDPASGSSASSSSSDSLFEAAAQAAEAVRWLAAEAAELPQEARGELLQLPLQLGSRVASRVTARALRSLVLGGGAGAGGAEGEPQGAVQASSTTAATTTSSTPAAPLVSPAGP